MARLSLVVLLGDALLVAPDGAAQGTLRIESAGPGGMHDGEQQLPEFFFRAGDGSLRRQGFSGPCCPVDGFLCPGERRERLGNPRERVPPSRPFGPLHGVPLLHDLLDRCGKGVLQ